MVYSMQKEVQLWCSRGQNRRILALLRTLRRGARRDFPGFLRSGEAAANALRAGFATKAVCQSGGAG
jgi:hypothetical protein